MRKGVIYSFWIIYPSFHHQYSLEDCEDFWDYYSFLHAIMTGSHRAIC